MSYYPIVSQFYSKNCFGQLSKTFILCKAGQFTICFLTPKKQFFVKIGEEAHELYALRLRLFVY